MKGYGYRGVETFRYVFDFGWDTFEVRTVEQMPIEDFNSKPCISRVVEMTDTERRRWVFVAAPDGTMVLVEVYHPGYEGDRSVYWALDPRTFVEVDDEPFRPAYLRRPYTPTPVEVEDDEEGWWIALS